MEIDLSRKRIAAGVLAGSMMLGGLVAPRPADAQDSTPANQEFTQAFETIEGNPLSPRAGLTPELLMTMGGTPILTFNSSESRVITYDDAPAEGVDGIDPAITAGFANFYLANLPMPIELSDLSWQRISTATSEEDGLYMTISTSNSEKLIQIANPDTFGAISLYGPNGIAGNYIEFQAPDIELPELASEGEFYSVLQDFIALPEGSYLTGSLDIQLGTGTNENPTPDPAFIENYKFLISSDNNTGIIAMINRWGYIHILETDVDTLSQTTGIDIRSELAS